jgi:hypothetical protein
MRTYQHVLKKIRKQNQAAKEAPEGIDLEEMDIQLDELPEETIRKHKEKIFPRHFKMLEKE